MDRSDRGDAPQEHVSYCRFHCRYHGRYDRCGEVSLIDERCEATLTRRHLNSSAPFNIDEYEVVWKRPPYPPWGFDYYPDFNFTNSEPYTSRKIQ